MERKNHWDVIVCGGGIAGIAAALAAKRTGANTLLVEKEVLPGGLATLGLISIYLPLDDGMGNLVTTGISEELLKLSIRYGYEDYYPAPWLDGGTIEEKIRTRYQVWYNPHWLELLSEELLRSEGVEILYDSRVIAADCTNDTIQSITVANKGGMEKFSADIFVDATGDADLAWYAGEETAIFDENRVAAWYQFLTDGKMHLRMMGQVDSQESKLLESFASLDHYTGLNPRQNSAALQQGHAQILQDLLKQREQHPDANPVILPTILQVRMTRRIVGSETMADPARHRYENSVGVMGNWRKACPAYQVPYGALHGNKITNLLTAGRSLSAEETMWELARVIPVAALTGQAAGTAAALCVKEACSVQALAVSRLQEKLKQDGVKLNLPNYNGI